MHGLVGLFQGDMSRKPQDLPEDPQMKIMAKTMEAHCGQVQWCSQYYRGEGHKLFRGLLGDL